jgi:hypothetical protein
MKKITINFLNSFRRWLRGGAKNSSARTIPDPLEQFILQRTSSPFAAGFDRPVLALTHQPFAR